jgi:undecaprenyl diphosphate synthase
MDPGALVSESFSPLDRSNLPRHVAIIMDGNGRWAQRRGLRRIRGHVVGVESVRVVTRLTRKLGIPYLTLFAFSEENWQRPALEIRVLMALLHHFLHRELPEFLENQVALKAIGDLSRRRKSSRTWPKQATPRGPGGATWP